MRLKRFLLRSSMVLLLLFAGAVTWLFTADLGVFKGQVENLVSQQLGREFSIDGELNIHLGRTVDLTAYNLRLASPDWASEPDLVTIREVRARVDLLSVLGEAVVIELLTISGGRIQLEVTEEGQRNWSFTEPATEGDEDSRATGFLFRQIEIEDLAFSLINPDLIKTLQGRIDRLSQEHLPDDMLQITTVGSLGDAPIEYEGQLGPWDSLVNGTNLKYDGSGRIGDLQFESDGHIDDVAQPRFPTFRVILQGPDFQGITDALGLDSEARGAYRIGVSAGRRGDVLGMQGEVRLGDLALDLEGTSASITDFSSVDYQVTAHGPDLRALTQLLGVGAWPRERFELEGAVHREGRHLEFQDISLDVGGARFELDGSLTDFPGFNKGTLELNISGPDAVRFRDLLGFKGIAEGAFDFNVKLNTHPDGTNSLQAHMNTSITQVALDGTLGSGPDYAGSLFNVSINGPDTDALLGGFGFPGFPQDPFSINAKLEVMENGLQFEEGVLVTMNDDRVEISGFLSFLPGYDTTHLDFAASGEDLSEFAPLAGADAPIPESSYQIGGGLRVTDAGFQIDALEGTVGPNLVSFDGLITRHPALGGSDFTFALSGPDLETLIRDTAGFDVPAKAFDAQGHFRHLKDSVRLEGFRLDLGRLSARADIDMKLPLRTAHGSFTATVSGPDINDLLPEAQDFQPTSQPFELRARGRVDAGTWNVEQASFNIADAQVSLQGVFDQPPNLSATDIRFEVRVPTVGSIGYFRGAPWPFRPIEVRAHLQGTADQFRMEDLHAQVSESNLTGSLVVDLSGPVPEIQADLRSEMLDMREWLTTDDEKEADAPPVPPDGRRIPDFQFPLEDMAALNAVIDIRGEKYITRNGVALEDFRLTGELRDGALRVDRLQAVGVDGSIDGSASLIPLPDNGADLAFELAVSGLKLELSLDEVVDQDQLPVVNVDFKAGGHGVGLREVAASMNGHLNATSSSGVIPNSAIWMLDRGLLEQAFSALLPRREQDRTTRLQCMAARLAIQEGVVKASPGIMLVTDKVQVVSNGLINLQTERLDMDFQAHPTKAYKTNVSEVLLNPFVKVSGTLAEPRLTLDKTRAIAHTGAAIGTGGLSILAKGLWDRLSKSKDPCAQFMAESGK